jgi:hypothetical protein
MSGFFQGTVKNTFELKPRAEAAPKLNLKPSNSPMNLFFKSHAIGSSSFIGLRVAGLAFSIGMVAGLVYMRNKK